MKTMYKNVLTIFVAATIGVLAFFIIYGATPLHVTNDNWIMLGYDESDIIQHYAGWLAFRASEWQFPLGMASKMAIGDGTIISYTDSIPIVAIFFKLIRGVLPETFQYFGIYALLCYVLQGMAAFLILTFKTKSPAYSYMGTVLFCFAPILLERSLRHTALGSQWLILFAIYIYFKHKEKPSQKSYIWMTLLEILSVGIHPYFLPMVASFALLCLVEDVKRKRYSSIILFLGGFAATYAFGWSIGVLGHGVSISRGGFGHFSMNLNAIINPTSCGQYAWSRFFKVHSQILGNYDGFNYLGAGILFGIAMLFFAAAFSTNITFATVKEKIKSNFPLITICVLLTLFAISNVVTFNNKILIKIPIGSSLNKICGIFRASSRMFYPTYYIIFIYMLYSLWLLKKRNSIIRIYMMLAILIAVQLFDISSCIKQKHNEMIARDAYKNELLNDQTLAIIGNASQSLILDPQGWGG